MRAGPLRRRITIQNKTVVNTDGSPVPAWVDEDTVWGRVRYLSGDEVYRADEIQSEAKVEIKIRYRKGMSEKKRLISGRHIYNIKNVKPSDKRTQLIMLCGEFTT